MTRMKVNQSFAMHGVLCCKGKIGHDSDSSHVYLSTKAVHKCLHKCAPQEELYCKEYIFIHSGPV